VAVVLSQFFFYQQKRLTLAQNSILFMLAALGTRNYMTIMTLQLSRIRMSDDSFLFIYFLIQREWIAPLVLLSFVNKYIRTQSGKKRFLAFLGYLFVLVLMDALSVYFKVVTYVQWNFMYAALSDILFLISGLALAKLVLLFQQRGELAK
jgi:hypothetical protein